MLSEVFGLAEARPDINNLPPGTLIEVFDSSPGAPPDGTWLKARILSKFTNMRYQNHIPAYYYQAPWTSSGRAHVNVDEYGKTWRLVDVN